MSREDLFKVTLTKLILFKSELSEQWLMWGGEIAVDRSAHSGQPLCARSCIHTHKAWLGSKIIINKQHSQLWPPHSSSKSVWEEVLTKEWSSSTVSRKKWRSLAPKNSRNSKKLGWWNNILYGPNERVLRLMGPLNGC